MDAVSCTAMAHGEKQLDHCRELSLSIRANAVKVPWMLLARAWDETPVTTSFGNLRDLVAPVARYWFPSAKSAKAKAKAKVKSKSKAKAKGSAASTPSSTAQVAKASGSNQDSVWTKLTYEEYKERRQGKEPKSGTLEMLGQKAFLLWPTVDSESGVISPVTREESMFFRPTFLASTTAATVFSCLDSTPGTTCNGLLVDLVEDRSFGASGH